VRDEGTHKKKKFSAEVKMAGFAYMIWWGKIFMGFHPQSSAALAVVVELRIACVHGGGVEWRWRLKVVIYDLMLLDAL
jgi:hypothetical protein